MSRRGSEGERNSIGERRIRPLIRMDSERINKDLELYCAQMNEIKLRIHVVIEMLKGHTTTLYNASNIEFMCLQIRKILEQISMGSLVVNKDEFEAVGKKYSHYWNAKLILQDIERLNPDFYPVAVREVPSHEDGVSRDLQNKESGFLTREQFVQIYDKCGRVLHSYNPFGSRYDYEYYRVKIKEWITLIMELLAVHLIKLKGGEGFYLIHMEERGQKWVHGYYFGRIEGC